MLNDPAHLDKRYSIQAQWSRQLREYLFRKYFRNKPLSVLEVGCGTGSVIRNICEEMPGRIRDITGIDKEPRSVNYASLRSPGTYCVGEGEKLPFISDRFDLVFCHYLLLWVHDPVRILREMKRVTVPGGFCAAMAEPCYAELAAFPDVLRDLAVLQRKSLVGRGMNPETGSRLTEYFLDAGFSSIESGQYQKCEMTVDFLKAEIRQMAEDVGTEMPVPDPGPEFEYRVPTYYAIAVK